MVEAIQNNCKRWIIILQVKAIYHGLNEDLSNAVLGIGFFDFDLKKRKTKEAAAKSGLYHQHLHIGC